VQRDAGRAMISADGEPVPRSSRPEADTRVRSRSRRSLRRVCGPALVVALSLAVPVSASQLAGSEPAAARAHAARAARATTLSFVRRNGTRLTLNGKPFRFTGINIYMAASGGKPSSCGGSLYPDLLARTRETCRSRLPH
jgi:hypothetical protein